MMRRFLILFVGCLLAVAEAVAQGQKSTFPRTPAERQFMEANTFLFRSPEGIRPFSAECIAYNRQKLDTLHEKLEQSGLSPDFIGWYRTYTVTSWLYQRLNSPRTLVAFGPSVGQQAEIPSDYYDFLSDTRFGDSRLLDYPKWFEALTMAMEEMERHGFLEVTDHHYLTVYARRIDDPQVRAAFLSRFIDLQFQMGYHEDIARQIDEVAPLLADSAVAAVRAQVEQARSLHQAVAPGAVLPPFTVSDITGKSYRLADFAGKTVLLDFWYTGCIPCKAEMPYLETLARQLRDEGANVQVVSVSLDTGEQLLAAWRKTVSEKVADTPILDVNLPGGFRSDFVRQLGIRSVPRMILVGPEGRIVCGFAKRPSDPKLRQQILTANLGAHQ